MNSILHLRDIQVSQQFSNGLRPKLILVVDLIYKIDWRFATENRAHRSASSILAVSSIPGASFPDIELYTLDKVFHFIEYSILGFFSVKCVRKPTWIWILLILIYGILFAGLDEYWQSFIPGRLSSQFDMLADISGIIFGSVLTMWISREND